MATLLHHANPHQIRVLDSLDDRREIVTLLRKLAPAQRIAWLSWCCQRAALGRRDNPIRPKVSDKTLALAEAARWDDGADNRLVNECYMDVWHLSISYDFDVNIAVKKLESFVRHHDI